MSKNILVTGGAGFIGSHLVDRLLEMDFRIIIIDALTYAAQIEYVPKNNPKVVFINDNINNSSIINYLLENYKIDIVINVAAESHVDRSIEKPLLFIQTNVTGTATLLHCCHNYWKNKKNFLYLQISTDEVYGSLNNEQGYFTENTPLSPRSPYAASKAAADQLVMAWYHTYNFPAIITRCSNNFGPRQHAEKLIPSTIINALNGRPIPIYGSGLNIRDWIYVSDHCHGMILAMLHGKIGEIYCFGAKKELTNIDLVKIICNKLDLLKPNKCGKSYLELISFVKDRLGHDYRYAINYDYAKKNLHFAPQHDFENSLAQTIKWYLNKT